MTILLGQASSCVLMHINKYRCEKGGTKVAKLRKQISFKENARDLEMYNFLEEEIQETLGISTYLKMLIAKDDKFIDYKNRKRT